MQRIAFDAMGGDHAPIAELDAAALLAQVRAEVGVVLVGDQAKLEAGLHQRGLSVSERLRIHHASEVILMDDAPSAAIRQKRDASMRVCFELVKRGEADAVVSAGNSGAMLACGLFVLKRLTGALRPGIVATLPTLKNDVVLCDAGANVEVQPALLAQFGLLGAVFAQVALGRSRPRVGLLSNGSEEGKGTETTRAAHALLTVMAQGKAPFEFAGYVEGRDLFTGDIDVVATDGFTGNIVLKTAEGAANVLVTLLRTLFGASARTKLAGLLARPALRRFRQRIDYAETGGAPLLGVDGLALVCHGSSSPLALKNAILQAARYAERGLVPRIAQALVASRADEPRSSEQP